MGETGPCGPCSEIHYDRTSDLSGGALVNVGVQEVIEVWNLVFIQFNRDSEGKLHDLPAKHVDTGMGFERICAVLQGVPSNYDTDVFTPLLNKIGELAKVEYTGSMEGKTDIAMRVIADHVRTLTFAIADGASPGNAGRGYVLRRILRRAVKYAFLDLDVKEPLLYKLVPTLVETMGETFPEIVKQQEYIEKIVRAEEESFLETLENGVKEFEEDVVEILPIDLDIDEVAKRASELVASNKFTDAVNQLSADWQKSFQPVQQVLKQIKTEYDSLHKAWNKLGQQVRQEVRQVNDALQLSVKQAQEVLKHDKSEVVQAVLRQSREVGESFQEVFKAARRDLENLKSVSLPGKDAFMLYDTFGFPLDLTELMARERGMTVDVEGFNQLMDEQRQRARDARKNVSQEVTELQIEGKTKFIGYSEEEGDASVVEVVEGGVVLDRTPFYAEMGGQLADTGEIVVSGERYRVNDVRKIGDAFVHLVEDGTTGIEKGENVHAEIDHVRRAAIERNHSATHILHEALRRVLGEHVQQAGSLVAPDHLRFDFNHFSKVGEAELREIEQMVNEKVREAIRVETEEMPFDEARKIPNVKMFFGDKYGSLVRVVTIDPDFSREFCGGTHVVNSAEIGLLKLTSEESIQSGVRRLHAVTGTTADDLLQQRYMEIDRLSRLLNVTDRDLYHRVEELLEEKKVLERELSRMRQEEAAGGLDAILANPIEQNGMRIVSGRVDATDMDSLKNLGDKLREGLAGLGGGIGLLGAEIDGKAMLVCVVTDEFTKDYPAGTIVGAAAKQLGGGGGGRPHMATAGGKDLSKLDGVLSSAKDLVG